MKSSQVKKEKKKNPFEPRAADHLFMEMTGKDFFYKENKKRATLLLHVTCSYIKM